MPDAPNVGQSIPVATNMMINFCSQSSAKITTSGTSQPIVFPAVGNTLKGRQTYKITNTGASNGAYLAWGHGSATAVASSTTPAPNCDYIAPGAILTQDVLLDSGLPANVIAVIQDGGGTTTLEISIGFGQ